MPLLRGEARGLVDVIEAELPSRLLVRRGSRGMCSRRAASFTIDEAKAPNHVRHTRSAGDFQIGTEAHIMRVREKIAVSDESVKPQEIRGFQARRFPHH